MITRKEALNAISGMETDALIAENIMGWHMIPPETDEDGVDWRLMWLDKNNKFMHNDWFPSADMSDAWEVVIHFADKGYAPNLVYDDNGHWALSFTGIQDVAPCTAVTVLVDYPELWCDKAPLAICRAALLTLAEDR